MSIALKPCPKCGGLSFKDNKGMDHSLKHQGIHVGLHNGVHGHPILAAVALTVVAAGFIFPKKLTCNRCGHTVNV